MSIKNKRKRSLTGVLSSVVDEMAKPRVAESAKRRGKILADRRDRPANPSVKEVPVPPVRVADLSERGTDFESVDAPCVRETNFLVSHAGRRLKEKSAPSVCRYIR
jgi:hypothetical protein